MAKGLGFRVNLGFDGERFGGGSVGVVLLRMCIEHSRHEAR